MTVDMRYLSNGNPSWDGISGAAFGPGVAPPVEQETRTERRRRSTQNLSVSPRLVLHVNVPP
jgi:hypothetical protein